MARKPKLFNVTEYCLKHKIEPCDFYKELNRHPKYACRLETDKYGEYVIDRISLTLVGDILRKRRNQDYRTHRKEEDKKNPIAAVAKELNFLVSENERLREELKLVKIENEYLQKIVRDNAGEKRRKN